MKVSIITPSFNQGNFIAKTIESVITQAYAPLEYVVMDGGSVDNTVAVLKQYHDQLTYVSETDRGQGHAVNKGIMQTTGDMIGWLNSDDIYYPSAIKKVCQFFAAHPDVDVVYGEANQIDRDNKVFDRYPTESWNLERLKRRCFVSQPATFFRRRVIAKYGLLDEQLQFCMDYEYWLRLALHGAKFAYLPDILAGTRIYAETKSSRGYLSAHLEAVNMLQKSLGYIPSDWIVNYASAKVKTETLHQFPHPLFIMGVWTHVWKIAGLHNRGLARLQVGLQAQWAMVKKLRFFEVA